jgi:hypothetical protein
MISPSTHTLISTAVAAPSFFVAVALRGIIIILTVMRQACEELSCLPVLFAVDVKEEIMVYGMVLPILLFRVLVWWCIKKEARLCRSFGLRFRAVNSSHDLLCMV